MGRTSSLERGPADVPVGPQSPRCAGAAQKEGGTCPRQAGEGGEGGQSDYKCHAHMETTGHG